MTTLIIYDSGLALLHKKRINPHDGSERHEYRMVGGKFGEHSIVLDKVGHAPAWENAVHFTSARLLAHWSGYCNAQHVDPETFHHGMRFVPEHKA